MKKVALFIDFDNIYSGLHRVAPRAADVFATDPASWLRWLETGMAVEDAPSDSEPRRILVRRCYLNPRVYQKYRAYFVLAGFDVVDCPPLTQQGKTSADIRMAMDVLDMLGHQTFFDEFVILSGDADFTPVLLRLRAHDRRTVILAVGFAAQAYKAACDIVIGEGAFIESALGISEDEEVRPADFDEESEPPRAMAGGPDTQGPLLDIIARDLAQVVMKGPVASSELPQIYRRQAPFRASNDWLGYGSLRSMTEAVVARRADLSMSPGNPWTVSLRAEGGRLSPPPEPLSAPAAQSDLRRAILTRVAQLVAQAPAALPLAKVANDVVREFGDVVTRTRWLGAGSFVDFLRSAGGLPFEVDTSTSPGYLRASGRVDAPAAQGEAPSRETPSREASSRDALSREAPTQGMLEQFARRISQVTGAPLLRPAVYAAVFRAAAEYLSSNEFNLYSASREVVKLTAAQGAEVSRTSVVFILRGIAYGGADLTRAPAEWSATELAQSFRHNLSMLCMDRGLALSEAESQALDRWLIRRAELPAVSIPSLFPSGAEAAEGAADPEGAAEAGPAT